MIIRLSIPDFQEFVCTRKERVDLKIIGKLSESLWIDSGAQTEGNRRKEGGFGQRTLAAQRLPNSFIEDHFKAFPAFMGRFFQETFDVRIESYCGSHKSIMTASVVAVKMLPYI
jgi:hypothetical protein